MEILRNPDVNVLTILGEPSVNIGCDKRFIKNCLYFDVDDGKVLMNSLTKAIVFIKNEEFDKLGDINIYSFLYKNYFFVDEDFDEWEAFEKVRKTCRKPVDDLYLNHPSAYTILTTTKCNARCSYCYENNTLKKRQDMTEETALKVAEYILKATPLNRPAELSWFGGEPLYNAKIINIICDYLRDNGKEFNSTITTNGYLFDDRLVKKAKNSWNLNFAQITIDGIDEDYNKIKNYIYKDQMSPYKKVINSLKALIKEGIRTDIRINIDPNIVRKNNTYYDNLINELYNIFGNDLKVYVYPLFDDSRERTEDDNINLYSYLCYLEDMLYDLNCSGKMPNNRLTISHCMADNGESIIIDPTGKFALCEHYNDQTFSDIDNIFKKDLDMIKSWKEYMNNREMCDGCPILGDCMGVVKCPDYGHCEYYKKEWYILQYLNGLKTFYNDYRKNNKLNCNCNQC